ncbi:EamA family transporter [Streptomyces marispadix]|uniref:EamA family transporter n=1 Tax=Streptomyces marispadix TaxID=2922868 RepID=A0ABS9T4U7_9ACTN|nr:EamA family transporter [Streptomyces marispadix]MCH6163561.1 EamA family transporter [Streptomyces marispadix]
MTGALPALASAACYGIADFTGGLLARRGGFALVALAGQAGGLVFSLALAPLTAAPAPTAGDLAWGGLSGAGTGLGMVFLYRGLSRGAMSVVVPVSAVGGVTLPVLAGVVVLGDRPGGLPWLGILTAVPALWLVSRDGPAHAASPAAKGASLDGLIAGAGIALQYMALSQAGHGSGIWPVATGRVTALAVIVPVVLLSGTRLGGPPRRRALTVPQAAGAAATGAVAALALVLYLLAVREQIVTVAVVLSSLYPVIPVLLGLTVLGERPSRLQTAGLLCAAAAVVLLTAD